MCCIDMIRVVVQKRVVLHAQIYIIRVVFQIRVVYIWDIVCIFLSMCFDMFGVSLGNIYIISYNIITIKLYKL